jgi:hypothetical protein
MTDKTINAITVAIVGQTIGATTDLTALPETRRVISRQKSKASRRANLTKPMMPISTTTLEDDSEKDRSYISAALRKRPDSYRSFDGVFADRYLGAVSEDVRQ